MFSTPNDKQGPASPNSSDEEITNGRPFASSSPPPTSSNSSLKSSSPLRSSDPSSSKTSSTTSNGRTPTPFTMDRKWATVSGEFKDLTVLNEQQKPDFRHAMNDMNMHKNRYGNVLPNKETQVKLMHTSEPGGNYINANFIRGHGDTEYIASQAPLQHTFGDFWQMIWEQKVKVIVMLTRLEEGNKPKAEMYWPNKGRLGQAMGQGRGMSNSGRWTKYGLVEVSLLRAEQFSDSITIRTFAVRLADLEMDNKERKVIQIHYEGWPDFGVPELTDDFRSLLVLMDDFNSQPLTPEEECEHEGREEERKEGHVVKNGPVLLHCSAGLGRTGTLIAAHIVKEKLSDGKIKLEDIDIKQLVAEMREQRHGMVQTKQQYKFLYEVVKELSQS